LFAFFHRGRFYHLIIWRAPNFANVLGDLRGKKSADTKALPKPGGLSRIFVPCYEQFTML
jgi:hypothetical protein